MVLVPPVIASCAELDEVPTVEELVVEYDDEESQPPRIGTVYEVPGVGQIGFGEEVRAVAEIALPDGGKVFFHEAVDGDPDAHGCTALLPRRSESEEHEYLGDNCLETFLALTPGETPVPAALAGFGDDTVLAERSIAYEPLGNVTGHYPLATEPRAVGDGQRNWYAHSCDGSLGGHSHWVNEHCDEGGADHCDPGFLSENLTISSGHTYKGSYQTGLFCNGGNFGATHYFKAWGEWFVAYDGWVHVGPGSGAIFWSTWRGGAKYKRRVKVSRWAPLTTTYRSYTKMCSGIVDCPLSG